MDVVLHPKLHSLPDTPILLSDLWAISFRVRTGIVDVHDVITTRPQDGKRIGLCQCSNNENERTASADGEVACLDLTGIKRIFR